MGRWYLTELENGCTNGVRVQILIDFMSRQSLDFNVQQIEFDRGLGSQEARCPFRGDRLSVVKCGGHRQAATGCARLSDSRLHRWKIAVAGRRGIQ